MNHLTKLMTIQVSPHSLFGAVEFALRVLDFHVRILSSKIEIYLLRSNTTLCSMLLYAATKKMTPACNHTKFKVANVPFSLDTFLLSVISSVSMTKCNHCISYFEVDIVFLPQWTVMNIVLSSFVSWSAVS